MIRWASIGRIHWGGFILFAAILLLLPTVLDTSTPTLLLIYALFALSLGLMWGYAGILSFGHSAYFGLGAYTYAIASTNIGESSAPLLLAILVPAAAAAVIGAMMFYGRISDVYMGVITLVVTLILYKFMRATAHPCTNACAAVRRMYPDSAEPDSPWIATIVPRATPSGRVTMTRTFVAGATGTSIVSVLPLTARAGRRDGRIVCA